MGFFSKPQSVCGRHSQLTPENFFGKFFEQISFYNAFWELVIARTSGHKEAVEEKWEGRGRGKDIAPSDLAYKEDK